MEDTAPWFAILAIAVLGWAFAFARSFQLRDARADIDTYQAEINTLEAQLFQARKNDARDDRGRFTRSPA